MSYRHGTSFFGQRKKIKKRDVMIKRFKNPYFLKSRMPRRTKAPKLKIGLGLLCLVGIAAVFLFHPFFLIANFNVKGNQTISTKDVLDRINQVTTRKNLFIFNGLNFFTIDTKQIEKKLKESFIFKNLKIAKSFPQTLNIEIEEKTAKAIFWTGNASGTIKYFILDDEGKVIRSSDDGEIAAYMANLPKITIESKLDAKLNENVINQANYEFISFLNNEIKKMENLPINYFALNSISEKTINIVTGEGWKIIFDRQNDWKKQIQVLETILRDRIRDRKNLKYIDVRFENRSYFQ